MSTIALNTKYALPNFCSRATCLLLVQLFWTLLPSATQAQTYERYKSWEDTSYFSAALGYPKQLQVVVPQEFQDNLPDQNFPLIVIFDSQNQRSYQFLLRTIDYLTSTEQMPASVIVGVASEMEHRLAETLLPATDSLRGRADQNEAFIFDELLPLCSARYKTKGFRMLVGHSRYGYFTAHLYQKRFDDLHAVVALSPVFFQKKVDLTTPIAKLYAEAQPPRQSYFRYCIGSDYPEDFAAMQQKLAAVNQPAARVNIAGYLFPQADHNVTPGLGIGRALYDIFEYWSTQQNLYMRDDMRDIDSLQAYLTAIQNHYGAALVPGLGILNGKGWFFFNQEMYTEAIAAWELMLTYYPNFTDGYAFIMDAQDKLGIDYQPTLARLRTSLVGNQFYEPEELKEIEAELKAFELDGK